MTTMLAQHIDKSKWDKELAEHYPEIAVMLMPRKEIEMLKRR